MRRSASQSNRRGVGLGRDTRVSKRRWRPLKHGEPFVMSTVDIGGNNVFEYRARTRRVAPNIALTQNWVYAIMCTRESEGLTWARGWKSKAAMALRASVAL